MIPRQFIISTAILFALASGMSIYVWHFRTREALERTPATVEEHLSPPASGQLERLTVWVAYDDPGVLRPQSISIPLSGGRQQHAEELLRALLHLYSGSDSPHRLQAGAEVHAVYLVEPGLAVVDLNAAFVDGQISGVMAEELTMASMIETLSANIPSLSRVKILVDGKERETLAGHVDISGFYDVAQVSELAKRLAVQ